MDHGHGRPNGPSWHPSYPPNSSGSGSGSVSVKQ
jgi:hypothetical protein